MVGRAVWWLAAAVALSASRGVLGDDVDWTGCPKRPYAFFDRHMKRGEVDHEVTRLYLYNCNITSLKPNDLMAYPNLKTFFLVDNNVKSIETGTFDSLVSLETLYLGNDALLGKDLPSNLLRNCYRLSYVAFANNDMSGTPADLLQGLNSMQYLDCDNTSLHEMASFITRPVFPVIHSLFLGGNQLSRLEDPATFGNVANLKVLNLARNKIEYLHGDLFKPFTQISLISMALNKIRYIPEQLFQNKFYLHYIDLSKNLIEHIPARAFFGTTRLKTLKLTDNRLTYLPDNFFSELHTGGVRLGTFYFDGNPWFCACLNETLAKVKALNITYDYYVYKKYDGKLDNCIMSDSFNCQRTGPSSRLL